MEPARHDDPKSKARRKEQTSENRSDRHRRLADHASAEPQGPRRAHEDDESQDGRAYDERERLLQYHPGARPGGGHQEIERSALLFTGDFIDAETALRLGMVNHVVPAAELIWASPRELLNVFQADSVGCHIITATNDILKKLDLIGKDLADYSLDTVKMFHNDAQQAGFSLDVPAAASH